MKSFRPLCRVLFLVLILSAVHSCKADETRLPLPLPQKLPAPLSVLVVGDSNTEIGHITGETARLMHRDYDYFGSGYRSLHPQVGTGSGYQPGLKISADKAWQRYEMVPANAAAPGPFLAPDGTAIRSSQTGAQSTVEFTGSAIDIYWLAAPERGVFSVSIDGAAPQKIETASGVTQTRRARLEKLPNGEHIVTMTVEAGDVTLLGVDTFTAPPGGARAVVHKWGKGWATSADFAAIEPRVFTSALELLKPDIVVLLLGTV